MPEPTEWNVCARDLRLARRFAEVISSSRPFWNQASLLQRTRWKTRLRFRDQGAARSARNRSEHEHGGARPIPDVPLGTRSADDVRGNPQASGRALRELATRRVQNRTVLRLNVPSCGTSFPTNRR